MNLYKSLKYKINEFTEKENNKLIEKAFEMYKQSTFKLLVKTNIPKEFQERFIEATYNPEFYLNITLIKEPCLIRAKYYFVNLLGEIVK